MRRLIPSMVATALALMSGQALADTLRMECAPSKEGRLFCNEIKQRFEAQTGHTLEFIDLPRASDEKLSLFQQLFAAKDSSAIDLFQADTVWIGVLNKHLLDLTDSVGDIRQDFFPAAWQNNLVNGRLKAVPAYLDTGALYYRKDLLAKYGEQPPVTWDDLTRIATRIQQGERQAGHKNFWGLVFQGKSYEGLTCNALEWVASQNGGGFIDAHGNITIDNPQAAKALDRAAGWIGTISPKGVLGYMEEESRAVFQNGDALFMRNWPYAYVLAQDDSSAIKGKVGVLPLPKGADGNSVSALGGWQWAISAYTKNPEAAIALLKIVSDAESQKKALALMGWAPSRTALYDDPKVLAQAPYLADFKGIFSQAMPRPATQTKRQYAQVSKAIYNATFNVLRGDSDGVTEVADLQQRLERIKARGWR
ncbi:MULTISPECIES: ABC transporter substrate-binding protein [unclassified Serratia (in: enterobacteria)]|uniref:ABC transporter substrate-binding protein n=1 Tax=unclassified Serratia (in: enterobacteria) TaxID=2647522 RepID=UPI002ED2B2E9|nr:ABC transporter substrate-binding protein [Serratia sp. C2(2)]MEE4446430.1 ABC transporter substrate-binding protein [Serratia sp. C2(1)]